MYEYIKIYQGYTWTECIKQAVEAIYELKRYKGCMCIK